MKSIARLTSVVLAPLLKQIHGLKKARRVSVHEVVVRLSLGELVPLLGYLQKNIQRCCNVYLVESVLDMGNLVITEMRHEEQICASSSM
jgi:hypothetical protein